MKKVAAMMLLCLFASSFAFVSGADRVTINESVPLVNFEETSKNITSIGGTTVIGHGKSFIICKCKEEPCQCFVQLGDHGKVTKEIIVCLRKQEYCKRTQKTDEFDEDVEIAVKAFQADHNLPQTGTMDDDTLSLLLWGKTPVELDAMHTVETSGTQTVWIPSEGTSTKRHCDPGCSRVANVRKVSVRNAELLGFSPCKTCKCP